MAWKKVKSRMFMGWYKRQAEWLVKHFPSVIKEGCKIEGNRRIWVILWMDDDRRRIHGRAWMYGVEVDKNLLGYVDGPIGWVDKEEEREE